MKLREKNAYDKNQGFPKLHLPEDIQQYILEFVPYLTRDDWRTCRHHESKIIQELIERYKRGKPRNNSHPVLYKNWTFYEQIRFGTIDSPLFPKEHLSFLFELRKIPYFF